MSPAVELHGVSRAYRVSWKARSVRALCDVTLVVEPGEILGIVGPNGSGKSTLLKVVLGLVSPTRGEVRVFGSAAGSNEARRSTGYLPDQPCSYRYFTGREVLEFHARLNGLPGRIRGQRIAEVLESTGIASAADQRVAGYSRGMLQRLGFAQAILQDPDLVVLDEPGNGLDPDGMDYVERMLARLREQRKTVLIASHLLAQLERTCDRVAVLVDGHLVRTEWVREGVVARDGGAFLRRDRLDARDRLDLERWMEGRGLVWSCPEAPTCPRLSGVYHRAVAQMRGGRGTVLGGRP